MMHRVLIRPSVEGSGNSVMSSARHVEGEMVMWVKQQAQGVGVICVYLNSLRGGAVNKELDSQL